MINFEYCLEVEYDGYYCDGCYGCDTGDDYCRGSVFYGLRVKSVDLKEVAKAIVRHSSGISYYSPVPELLVNDVQARLIQLGIDENSFEFSTYGSYYGEEYDVYLMNEESILKELDEILKNHPMNRDKAGILQYCRDKGIDTSGLSPIGAVLAQLQDENKITLKKLDKVSRASVKRLKISDIKVGNQKHYDKAEPKPATKLSPDAPKIVGVILNGVLIDGYHRLKFVKEKNQAQANFIVLE